MAGVDPGARALTSPSLAVSTYFPPKPSQWRVTVRKVPYFASTPRHPHPSEQARDIDRLLFGQRARTLEGCVPNILESHAIPTAILKWNATLEATECAVGCGACC